MLIGSIFQYFMLPAAWMSADEIAIGDFTTLDSVRAEIVALICHTVNKASLPEHRRAMTT